MANNRVAYIASRARAYGLDPKAVLAIAAHEGLSGGVGDNGTSFGPWQLHEGGALPQGIKNPQQWAWSPQGINYALQTMAKDGAAGLTGQAAVSAISRNFERPANPGAEIADAMAHYGKMGSVGTSGDASYTIGAQPGGSPGGAPMQPSRAPHVGGNQNGLLSQMLAQQLLSSAGQVVSGAESPAQGGAGLVALALARQQAQAADQTFGPGGVVGRSQRGAGGPTARPAGHAGPTESGYQGRSIDGNLPMVFGGKSPYTNIRFGSNVDWQHVNPRLLKAINDVARTQGKVVDVNSGYRSNQYSQKVGGFAGDPHSKGLAVDAYVNGVPINKAINPSVWQAYGVRPGSSFTYGGSPDWEHLDLL